MSWGEGVGGRDGRGQAGWEEGLREGSICFLLINSVSHIESGSAGLDRKNRELTPIWF